MLEHAHQVFYQLAYRRQPFDRYLIQTVKKQLQSRTIQKCVENELWIMYL